MKKPLRYHRNSLKESRPTDSDTSTPLMMITLKDYTVDTKATTKETTYIGTRYTKKQYNLSGRSLGRSTGPVKKSGANKRTGGGKRAWRVSWSIKSNRLGWS